MPGNDLIVGTKLYRQRGLDLKRFFTTDDGKREGRESSRMQEKQHLVNDRRNIKPPKEPQKWQSLVQSTLNKSESVNQDAISVFSITHRASRAWVIVAL